MTKETRNALEGVIDFIFAFLVVSGLNLIIMMLFGLSPTLLLRRGIETSVFQEKIMQLEYLSIIYVVLIIAYLVFGRKYFSLGKKMLEKK